MQAGEPANTEKPCRTFGRAFLCGRTEVALRRPLSLCENEPAMRTRKAFVIAGLWAFLVVVAVHFIQFPGSVPDFNRASDGGILLDASPAFTPDGIYDRLTGYGEGGRRNYSLRNVTIDVLLPLVAVSFGLTAIGVVFVIVRAFAA